MIAAPACAATAEFVTGRQRISATFAQTLKPTPILAEAGLRQTFLPELLILVALALLASILLLPIFPDLFEPLPIWGPSVSFFAVRILFDGA